MSRVFVGLPISEALGREIAAWTEERFSDLPVRWIAPRNLHVTLVPPFTSDHPQTLFAYSRELENKNGSIELEFTRVTFGPYPREPRLIWAEGPTPPVLPKLVAELHRSLGLEPPSRPFRLHLTIARFAPEKFASFPIKQLEEPVAWHDTADRFVLYESHLGDAGAEYEVLGEIKL